MYRPAGCRGLNLIRESYRFSEEDLPRGNAMLHNHVMYDIKFYSTSTRTAVLYLLKMFFS
jgi:hypothetical protein